jgi:predicted site-specific integrase-resolvase
LSFRKKAPKRRIGYARVSTEAQDLTRQLKALRRVPCDPVFSDKASGKSMAGRPALAEALDELDEGDELVIAEWDRATRSVWDGFQIIKAVIDAKASVKGSRPQLYRPRDTYGPGLHGDAVRARRRRTVAHHQAHP